MRYYIADCHFFHGTLNEKMDGRGFESVEKMNEYMLHQWNSRVRNNDEVIILGDLSWGTAEETKWLLEQLKDRDHRYFDCPRCRQRVRVPRGKGKISISCPKCHEKFVKKT
jgi:predicted phosphohydrolase